MQAAAAIRMLRREEQDLLTTELEIEDMRQKAPGKVAFTQQKQAVKAELLMRELPDLDLPSLYADGLPKDAIYRIYPSADGRPLRIKMRDNSWVEQSGHTLRFWGGPGVESQASTLVGAIARTYAIDDIQYTAPAGNGTQPGHEQALQKKQRLEEQEAFALVEKWRGWGFTDVVSSEDGVWIKISSRSRLQDVGNRVFVHGQPPEDDAIKALVLNAQESWGGQMTLFGDDDFKARAWLESQRQGVRISGYTPPPHIIAIWEKEQRKMQSQKAERAIVNGAIASISDDAKMASYLKDALRGDPDAVKKLDDALTAFVFGFNPDKAEKAAILQAENADIVVEMNRFREYGRAHIDPQASLTELKDWLEGKIKSVPPTCQSTAALAQHYKRQGMASDDIAREVGAALKITDAEGNVRSADDLKKDIRIRAENAMKGADYAASQAQPAL